MRALSLTTLACAVALAGCSLTPPSPSPTPSIAPGTAQATSASTGASPTGDPSTDPSESQGPLSVLLTPTNVGDFALGSSESEVEAHLTATLGKPDDTYSGKVCELNSDTPWGRQLKYGGVWVAFQSAAKKGADAPRKLTGWIASITDLTDAFVVSAPYPTATTYADLKTAFPAGKLEKFALGEADFYTFTTPSGLWYRGEDPKTPTDMGIGAQEFCE